MRSRTTWFLALPLAASALLLASCARGGFAQPGPPRAVVAIDEAFEAARPALAQRLAGSRAFGDGPFGLFGGPLVVRVALSEGAGKALESAIAESGRSGRKVALIASPLIAGAIARGGSWSGSPALLVPEWRGPPFPGLASASTDPLPAYAAAGAAAGAFVAALAREGGSPSCGVLFSESPSRPRTALAAFASAYAEASEGRPLYVRELDEGAGPGPAVAGGPPQPAEGQAGQSPAAAAAAAARELLGEDIRVLFVALGSSAGAAITAAASPGLAIGADFPAPEPPQSLAFRILPDDESIALALERRRAAMGREAGSSKAASQPMPEAAEAVPALLVPGPGAASARAGKRDFASFLPPPPKKASKP
jgi:hypothetical protein